MSGFVLSFKDVKTFSEIQKEKALLMLKKQSKSTKRRKRGVTKSIKK